MRAGELTVTPNPVLEGQPVEVSFDGEGPLYYSVDGGPWEEMPLTDGEGSLDAPIGSSVLVFSDRKDPATEAGVSVESSTESSP